MKNECTQQGKKATPSSSALPGGTCASSVEYDDGIDFGGSEWLGIKGRRGNKTSAFKMYGNMNEGENKEQFLSTPQANFYRRGGGKRHLMIQN